MGQESEDVKQLLTIAKSLERREKEEGGKVDKDTATILQAAKSLASKELGDQKKQQDLHQDLDHRVQDELRAKQAEEQAKREAVKLLQENTMEAGGTDVEDQVKYL